MDCPSRLTQEKASAAYLDFASRVMRERIPVSGGIEITRRCNFDCIHCYLGSNKNRCDTSRGELITKEWLNIINEIAEAGCLYLLFTGGEPLLRKDFTDIYIHAKNKGLVITVFTNGSLINESLIKVLKEYPPNCVEVSLYGSTERTYETVTRRKGMFEKSLNGIRQLIDNGIPTRIKTILLTKNRHEFDDVRQMAESLGVRFRFDGMIFPCLDGNRAPTAYRVSPEEVAEKNLIASRLISEWRSLAARLKQVPLSDVLFDCSAGTNNFHIDPWGGLKPCLMVRDVCYDLLSGTFMDGWSNCIPEIRKKKIPLEFECKTCENRAYCGYCPAFFRLDTGSETKISKYLCRIGSCMGKRLSADDLTVGNEDVRKYRTEKTPL